uniref:Alkyl hydroperoxide reductase subunit C/ Thiol specific antioxidant domain-containing protein n=1 Tax=Lactuca sativa TaxID=4236 RepID=A0A9R1UUQ3_LACSA|nr:hypothetical protein LSAT_V11C800393770 [Lactuca sativa]
MIEMTQKVKLSDYIGKKYVIFFFYPLHFTFVCPTEITAFSDRQVEFNKKNTILGVLVDSVLLCCFWDALKHIRHAIAFLVTQQKRKRTPHEISYDLCLYTVLDR